MCRYCGMRYLALLSLLSVAAPVLSAAAASASVVRPAAPSSTPAPPTITSTGKHVYTSGVAKNYVGTPGVFTLSDPGSTVTGYYYSFTGGFLGTFVPAGPDGTVSLAITPYSESALTLFAAAVNGSSAPSPQSSFVIETVTKSNNIATLAWWKMSAGHGTVAADATGDQHGAVLGKNTTLSCSTVAAPDGYRCWLKITAGGGQAMTRPAILPVVGNDGSFSVSAWVELSKCASSCIALSADATQTDMFALGYQKACAASGKTGPCWQFSMPSSDSTSAGVSTAVSPPGSAKLAKWTQLTGVFNASHGTLTLYVNGVQVGQVSPVSPWSAPGPGQVRIGNLIPGGSAHTWLGALSNGCVFYGVLQPADVTVLYKGNAAHPHNGCAALHAEYP
jgi:Concanavalin A-like lectin/glucanases superfamily